jgi:hypothetical protein
VRFLFLALVAAHGAVVVGSLHAHASLSRSLERYQARLPRLRIGRKMPESMSLVICFAETPNRAMTSRRRSSFMDALIL